MTGSAERVQYARRNQSVGRKSRANSATAAPNEIAKWRNALTTLDKNSDEAMQNGLASFEMHPPGAPQDEGTPLIA